MRGACSLLSALTFHACILRPGRLRRLRDEAFQAQGACSPNTMTRRTRLPSSLCPEPVVLYSVSACIPICGLYPHAHPTRCPALM
eukprot:1259547-Rhodomonas_salina.1